MTSTIDDRGGLMLLVVLTGAFLGQFDTFVVNVAAPSIQASLTASDLQLQLVVAGYVFAFAASLITGGRLGDSLGRRRVYVIGLIGFAVTTLLCGLAPTPTVLIVARVAQGLAAGLLMPQVLGSVNTLLPAERRLSAMGWYGAATGLGSIVGQFAGGALVAADLFGWGWRWVFFVSVPLSLLAAMGAVMVLPRSTVSSGHDLDPVGVVGLTVGLGLMMAGVLIGAARPVSAAGLGLAGVAALVLAVVHERRLAGEGGEPVLDPTTLRLPSVWRGLLAVTAFMLYFGSFLYLFTNVVQRGLGLRPLAAGLVFVPSGIAYASTSMIFRRWSAARQVHSITLGCSITVVGLVVVLLGTLRAPATARHLIVALLVLAVVLTGVGNGLTLPVLIGYAVQDVPATRAGVGAAMVTTVQQFAGSLGIAGFGTLYYDLAGPGQGPGFVRALGWCAIGYIAVLLAIPAVIRSGRSSDDQQQSVPALSR